MVHLFPLTMKCMQLFFVFLFDREKVKWATIEFCADIFKIKFKYSQTCVKRLQMREDRNGRLQGSVVI